MSKLPLAFAHSLIGLQVPDWDENAPSSAEQQLRVGWLRPDTYFPMSKFKVCTCLLFEGTCVPLRMYTRSVLLV